MAVTITKSGQDLKVDEGSEINNYPINDITKRVVGTSIELYLRNTLVKSFNESEFVSPTGTAEAIADQISQL